MLQVKTFKATSKIPNAGIGLFANEDIKAGTVVWKFDQGIDMIYTEELLAATTKDEQEQIKKHAYYDDVLKVWVLCADDAVMFNHSATPNCREEKDSQYFQGRTIAIEDIKIGDELTCDYFEFDAKAKEKLSM